MSSKDKVEAGFYAKKQLLCNDRLIAWSHRRRFETGLDVLRALKPKRLLDYGSGDGTFLAMLFDQEWRPAYAMGAELDPEVLKDCRNRFEHLPSIEFCLIPELADEAHHCRYDTVVCMEVLEHVVDLPTVLAELDHALAPGGRIAVSVPVETGLPVFAKQTARRIAGWRGLGDYSYGSRYTVFEMCKSVFAGSSQHMVRPVYRNSTGSTFHDHQGFNWRTLKKMLGERFALERTVASPVAALGPLLASQVWFVCRKRA